jgi:hypothetical protein
MSDEFDGLDVIEKAAVGAELNRCRVLAAKIANELRNKRPEADIHSSLERAADVLSTLKDSQAQDHQHPGQARAIRSIGSLLGWWRRHQQHAR